MLRSNVFKLLCLLLIPLAFLRACGAWADEQPQSGNTIRIAYVEFPPITYRDKFGEPAGEYVDITRKVAQEAGYQLEFVHLPVGRVYLYLKNGQVDLWMGMTGIPALHNDVLESWVSPIVVQLSAWYREDTEPVTHIDQLRNKMVILIVGYTYRSLRSWLEQQGDIQVTDAPNHRSAIDMLKRNRGDYLLDYRQPIRESLTRPTDGMIRESEVRSRNGAWLFSLANPRAAILREDFDDAYLRLAAEGKVPAVRKFTDTFVLPGLPEERH